MGDLAYIYSHSDVQSRGSAPHVKYTVLQDHTPVWIFFPNKKVHANGISALEVKRVCEVPRKTIDSARMDPLDENPM